MFFISEPVSSISGDPLDLQLQVALRRLMHQVDGYEKNGSGWVLDHFVTLDVHIVKYNPLRAGAHIPLSKNIRGKASILNIKNSDDDCFELSILAKLFPAIDRKSANRAAQYRKYQGVLKEVHSSMPIELIAKFEESNMIAVNVYELDENECVRTLQGSSLTNKAREHVDLLYIQNEQTSHYCLITNLAKLLHHCSTVQSTFTELPEEIAAKKACVNVQ